MNKIVRSGLLLAMAALTSACVGTHYAEVPAPTRFDNTKQQKLQAAEHWRAIAEHFASQMGDDLKSKLDGRAVYVPQPGGEQPFVEGFRELFITALVSRHIPVSTEAHNALTVDVKYSIYRFRPERVANTYFLGDATALAAGLWAVSGIVGSSSISRGAKALATVAGVEGFLWIANEQNGAGQFASGPVPRSEIILTASVADASRIMARRSNIYYTMDEDAALYWQRASAGHSVSVSGDCEGRNLCTR